MIVGTSGDRRGGVRAVPELCQPRRHSRRCQLPSARTACRPQHAPYPQHPQVRSLCVHVSQPDPPHRNVPGVLRDLNKSLEVYNVSQQYLSTTKEIGYAVIDVDKVRDESHCRLCVRSDVVCRTCRSRLRARSQSYPTPSRRAYCSELDHRLSPAAARCLHSALPSRHAAAQRGRRQFTPRVACLYLRWQSSLQKGLRRNECPRMRTRAESDG